MTVLYCRQGGLMGDPAFHWEKIGEADGSSLKEVADALALKDPEFARCYNPERITFWGWQLSIEPPAPANTPKE